MPRHINADSFAEAICNFPAIDEHTANAMIFLLHEQPTADIVEVIRCKDCKHRETFECPMYFEEDIEWDDDGYTECEIIIHDMTTDDSFCSYGERCETSVD